MNSDNKQRKIADGVNTKVYPNGAKYVGGWRDGKWHGKGTVRPMEPNTLENIAMGKNMGKQR